MSFGVAEILDWVEGKLLNAPQLRERLEKIRVDRPASLLKATENSVAYFFNKAYAHELPKSRPGVLITAESFAKELEKANLPLWETSAIVSCPDPYWAMALLSEKFATRGGPPNLGVGDPPVAYGGPHRAYRIDKRIELIYIA